MSLISEVWDSLIWSGYVIRIYPRWCGSVDWVPACEPKGCWFNSQTGHMPGLQTRSPVGGTQEATTHWCFSPSLSPSLPFSKKKINKILKKKSVRNMCLANIFPPFFSSSFHSPNSPFFKQQNFLMLTKFNLSVFFFWIVLLVSYVRNYSLTQGHKVILLSFLLEVLDF